MAIDQNGKRERAAFYGQISPEELAAFYGRNSTDEQVEAGTIENQIDFKRRWADLHQVKLFKDYLDEGVSGTIPIHERPFGSQMMADARAHKFKVVLVWRLDRFARRLKVLLDAYEALDELGIAVRSMTEPIDTSTAIGRLLMQILGSFAEFERESILERSALGRQRALREGRWVGGLTAYGYKVVEHRLIIDPEEAPVVARMFRLYTKDLMGLEGMADLLNAEGVPTVYDRRKFESKRWPDGEFRWCAGTVSRMLRNAIYVGRYQVGKVKGGEIVEYPVPAIVDRATFDAAQERLKQRLSECRRADGRIYPLTGIFRCWCGRAIVGDGSHKQGKFYYVCQDGHFRRRAEEVEGKIWQDVAQFARNPGEPIAELHEKMKGQAKETEDVAAELADVGRQIMAKKGEQDSVITLFRRKRISEDQLDKQLDELNREIQALTERQQALLAVQMRAQAQEADMISAEAMLEELRVAVDQVEQDSRSGDPEVIRRAMLTEQRMFKRLIKVLRAEKDKSVTVVYRFRGSQDGPEGNGESGSGPSRSDGLAHGSQVSSPTRSP